MPAAPDVRVETLTRFLFTAPAWPLSLLLIAGIGIGIDLAGILFRTGFFGSGTLLFTIPGVLAFLFTLPLVRFAGGAMTWNRSALLALVCAFISVVGTVIACIMPVPHLLPFLYAYSLGFIFALRLLVLTAVASYRTMEMLAPAGIQSLAGIGIGLLLFGPSFLAISLISNVSLAAGCILLIYLIERPFFSAFDVHVMRFLNAYLAHLTDGSRDLEDFFRYIGQEAVIPETTIHFRRRDRKELLLTVPNVHPGPMGEVGGTNLPTLLHDAFGGEVLVCHGAASHDYNPVGAQEVEKLIAAVKGSLGEVQYAGRASGSCRFHHGSVSVLAQAIGDSVLLVVTRAPEKTEDLVPAIGQIVAAEGRRWFRHVAFVDAHNCMTEVTTAIHPTQPLGSEYIGAAVRAMEVVSNAPRDVFRAGTAHIRLPFGKKDGFGPLGVQALVIEAQGQRTAYVLLDGNNMVRGLREELVASISGLVDEAEVMTTDTHVVNTISGINPIGLRVPSSAIAPYVVRCVQEALEDLTPSEAGGATAECRGIVVFGPERIAQLASTVNTIVIFMVPLGLALLLLAYLLSLLAYMLIL